MRGFESHPPYSGLCTRAHRRGTMVGMIVAFSVAPSGTPSPSAPSPGEGDASLHNAVAAAVAVVRASGLPNRTDSMFTNIVNLGHGYSVRPAAI